MISPAATSDPLRERVTRLVTDDRAALLMGQPFLAALAMQLPIVAVIDPRLPTAGTDGRKLFVSAPLFDSLSAHDRRFLLAHVVWHCALLHPWRRTEREAPWWDLAIDHEVNAILGDLMPVPEDAVRFEERIGESAEQIYQQLVAGSDHRARGRLADVHPTPGVPVGMALPDEARSDPAYTPRVDREGEHLWAQRVLAAAVQVERRGGTLPGSMQRLIRQLRHPELPWSELLRQFVAARVGDERVWLPPSRRHWSRGVYLPSRHAPLLRVAVALDTSASTQGWQPRLLGELSGIASAYGRYELRLVQGDARVQSVRTYTQDDPLPADGVEVRGFGGTDFRPVFDHLARNDSPPSALIFLTDGHGDAPEHPPDYPVLWALTPRGRSPTAWGNVLRMGCTNQDGSG